MSGWRSPDAWWRPLLAEPLLVPALLLFFSARSSAIFGGPGHADAPWHQAFVGWYDAVLLFAILGSIGLRCFAIDRDTMRVIAGFGLVALASYALGGRVADGAVIDGMIHALRFAAGFSIGVWLVRARHPRLVETVLWLVFVLLLTSAVFVYGMQFSSNQRLYFSGMTMASSSQVAAVIALFALVRGARVRLACATLFLLLTFSRTSIVVTAVLCLGFVLFDRGEAANERRVAFVFLAVTAVAALWLISGSPVFADVLLDRFDTASLETLGLRLDIWEFARHDLLSGEVPVFGVGFGCTPSMLDDVELRTPDGWTRATHFHSILIEYAFGLGVLAVLPMLWLVRRTIAGLAAGSPAVLLLLLFAACQAVDFSFYRPKEVLFWSLVLGIADGHIRAAVRRAARSSSPDPRHPPRRLPRLPEGA
jgi:hypothetical protein